ncbi:MAG: DUF4129 domain-containing protein [Chloroflexi bacterium]|nr:DUF4129 domain-containing protein [Chloroflexota bacterium]
MRRFLSVWLIAILSLMNLAAVDEPPISFDGYWELVRNTRQTIIRLEASPENDVRAGLDELVSQWEHVKAVEFPDQSVVSIDPSHLIGELKKEPPDLGRLEALMDALLQAHEEYPRRVFTVQDVEPLREILERPEFQWQEAQPAQNPAWIQRILDAIAEFMNRLAYGVQNGVYYGRVPLILAAVLLFLLSLYFITRNLSRSLVREAELAAENGDEDAVLTSKGAMQRAQTLSGQGDYRNAVRYLYLSSLLILDEHGVLRYDRSRTNREYLRSVSSKPELAKPLGDVIDVFDRVWYGFEAVDDEAYRSYVKHVDELREKKE